MHIETKFGISVADEKSSLKGARSGSPDRAPFSPFQGHLNRFFLNFTPREISPERLRLQFLYGQAMWCISLVMTDCPSSQSHMSNFYIVDLENVAIASRRCIDVVKKYRRRSAGELQIRRPSASWLNAQVYYTLVDCNPLTPLLLFVVDLSYKLFLHCYAVVGKISTDTSRRAVRLRYSRASC